MNNLSLLSGSLERFRLSEGSEDIRKWVWDFSEQFYVKSFFKSFFHGSSYPYFPLYHFIWKAPITSKIQVFSWTVVFEKLPTCETMQKRSPNCSLSPSWCVLCRQVET